MFSIKKILFPVDFSERCVGAGRYVAELAGRFGAELMLLYVVDPGFYGLDAHRFLEAQQDQVNTFLAEELKHFTTRRVALAGVTATAIVDTAHSWGADLVMMPTHGLGTYRRLILGSVTAKVLHDVECPVWTGVHMEEAPRLDQIACRKILCAIDRGGHSGHLLEWAAAFAGEYQAELGIVNAIPVVEAAPGGFLDREFAASLESEAKTQIGALQAKAGTKARVLLGRGNPGSAVSWAAKEFHADLLIIGRHAGTGVLGRLRQNAYAILCQSPCPVISI